MSNNRTAPIKPTFQMSCNEGQFDVVEVINLNAQHVNGMTRLLDTSEHLTLKIIGLKFMLKSLEYILTHPVFSSCILVQ